MGAEFLDPGEVYRERALGYMTTIANSLPLPRGSSEIVVSVGDSLVARSDFGVLTFVSAVQLAPEQPFGVSSVVTPPNTIRKVEVIGGNRHRQLHHTVELPSFSPMTIHWLSILALNTQKVTGVRANHWTAGTGGVRI